MKILLIVFFLNVCGCPQALSLAISDILEIVKLSEDVVTEVIKTFKLLYEDIGLSSKEKVQRELFKKIRVFKEKIDMLSAQMGIGSQVLYAMVGYTNIQFEQKLKLIEVIKNIDVIKLEYKNMGTFIKRKEAYDCFTLEEFDLSVVSHSKRLLNRIHAIIAPGEDEDYSVDGVPSVFKLLYEIMKERDNKLFCNMQTSEQQLYLHLYNTLALTELKGFLMMEFSYMLHKLHNQGNFTNEIEAAQEQYKDRSATTLKLFIRAATLGESYLWKCDPDPYKQVKNETYIEITELLQGYLTLELDIFRVTGILHGMGCDRYAVAKIEVEDRNYSLPSPYDRKYHRRCSGNLINCKDIADGTVCLARGGTNRRYHYISQAGSVLYGRYGSCEVVTPYRSVHLRGHTNNNCMCICDDPGVNSDRYFSLRSSESDIGHNMVVTGLRFVKKNRIIHLQIQQGKLLPRAKIDVGTVHWKPVEDYKINDPGVRDGQDYHMLTWYKRGFDLDNLLGKDDELVTGVKFWVIGSHLNFQIRLTPFNFTTGKLNVGKTRWNYNITSQNNRKKLNFDDKDIPLLIRHHSRSGSSTHAYLEFTHTAEVFDLMQTTVPFIDAQAVTSAKPVPLRGAGVLSEEYHQSGGFIYPQITTFDYSRLFDDADTHFGKKVVDKK